MLLDYSFYGALLLVAFFVSVELEELVQHSMVYSIILGRGNQTASNPLRKLVTDVGKTPF